MSFKVELPDELMKQLAELETNVEKMAGEMTTEASKVVESNIRSNAPASLRSSNIMNCLKITKVYEDAKGRIGNKIAFYSYYTNSKGKKTPAPLVANVFEYGRSNFTKQPFMRKSFNKQDIENAMLKVQEKYIRGDK